MKRLLALLVTAALGCAQSGGSVRAELPTATQPELTPLLWRVEPPNGGSGGFFLFGSVHIGTPQMLDLGPTIADAYAQSEELVVELDISKVTEGEIERLGQRYSNLPDGQTLKDRLSPETYALLERYLRSRGISPETVARNKPWLIAQMIILVEFQNAGFDLDLGVDRVFLDKAEGHKPVVGIETLESQMKMMDELPDSTQELMLKDALVRIDDLTGATRELLDAWQRGDEDELMRLVFSPLREFPELSVYYDEVFFRRNVEMTEALEALTGDGKLRFVVLGAGHMIGERGIPTLLRARGYRVRQIGGSAASSVPLKELLDQSGWARRHAGIDQSLRLVVGAARPVEGGVDSAGLAHE